MKIDPNNQEQKNNHRSVDFSDVLIMHEFERRVTLNRFHGHDILQHEISRKWYEIEHTYNGRLIESRT